MSIELDYMLHVYCFKCIIVQQGLCYHSDNDSKRRKRMSLYFNLLTINFDKEH